MSSVGAIGNDGLEKSVFEPSQLELLAASLRLNNSDIQNSLNALSELLRSVSPSGFKVKRRRKSILSKETVIEEISIRLKDQIYTITVTRSANPIACSRSKVVRDIVIKTDELTMDKWAASLSQQMAVEAEQSEESRNAINRILGLN